MGSSSSTIVDQNNPQQRALANVSKQKWNYYQKKYVPLENKWMEQVGQMDSQGNHNEASGMAASTLKQTNGVQSQSVGNAMDGQRMGTGDYFTQAGNESNVTNSANQGVTKRMLQGEQGIVAMGQGQSAGAISGLSSVAQQSVEGQAANMRNSAQQQQNTNSIYGTAAGMGAATAINKWGGNK